MNMISLVIKMNAQNLFVQKATWFSLFLFSLTLLIVFPFAFGVDVIRRFDIQIGCYWMIQEFLAALLILNMFKLENEGHVMDIYASTRNSKLSLFFGKVIFTTLHLISLQIPLMLAWMLIFNPPIETLVLLWPRLFVTSGLFALNASLLGAFLYVITHKNALKETLQSLFFFPLQSASLLASVGLCLEVQNVEASRVFSSWWVVILAYPILLVGLAFIFAETLLDEL